MKNKKINLLTRSELEEVSGGVRRVIHSAECLCEDKSDGTLIDVSVTIYEDGAAESVRSKRTKHVCNDPCAAGDVFFKFEGGDEIKREINKG